MPEYRLYFISPEPRHIRDLVRFIASDDLAAVRRAAELADGRAMELWNGDRLVKAFEAQR
jgi:hypothetical protein